jgi:2-succinyl-6-hydroxy-2,4-cyclohexadiene-1-carboxylate synthase
MNKMKERFINLENGININVKYNKKNNKPAILFLHFGSGNLKIWDGIFPYFEEKYQVIIPDFRGHGKSSKPKEGYHIEDLADDIKLLLEELETEEYYIIGSSLGAEVGAVVASDDNNVKALLCEGALYNQFGQYGIHNGSEEEIEKMRNEKLQEVENRKEEYYKSEDEYLETEKRFLQRAGLWNRHFEAFVESNVCYYNDKGYASCYPIYVSKEYMRNYYYFNFEKYYKNINCPVLFLPTRTEWNNEKIKSSIKAFGNMAGKYKVSTINGFNHAYGWMKVPNKAVKLIKELIEMN